MIDDLKGLETTKHLQRVARQQVVRPDVRGGEPLPVDAECLTTVEERLTEVSEDIIGQVAKYLRTCDGGGHQWRSERMPGQSRPSGDTYTSRSPSVISMSRNWTCTVSSLRTPTRFTSASRSTLAASM